MKTNTGLILAATIVAAGTGGVVAARRGAPAAAANAAALAAAEARIATLETEVAKARRDYETALRQGTDAMATALEAIRELERLRERQDDILLALEGAGPGPKPGAPPGGGGPRLAAGPRPPHDDSPPESTDHAAFAANAPKGGGVVPGDVAVVKQALEEIRRAEEAERRAQREERRKEQISRRVADLAPKLGLTADQQERLTAVFIDANAHRQALWQAMRESEGAGDPRQMRETMRAVREEEERKVQEILSPQQYAELQKIREEERREQQEEWGRFRRGGGGGAEAIPLGPP
jgi:hypothetical protein